MGFVVLVPFPGSGAPDESGGLVPVEADDFADRVSRDFEGVVP